MSGRWMDYCIYFINKAIECRIAKPKTLVCCIYPYMSHGAPAFPARDKYVVTCLVSSSTLGLATYGTP